MTDQLCCLDGAIIPLAEAKIGVLDLGVTRGFGIYEGITAFRGEPFRFDDHWERFLKSANTLGLTVPHAKNDVLNAMRAIIAHNARGERANLRMVLTGGNALNGIEYMPGCETLFVTAEDYGALPAALYESGGRLVLHEHRRFMPEIKTINYITAVMLQKKRIAAGAIEILYKDGVNILECATSNVFIVKNGLIVTPSADVLHGITRKVALELAREVYPTEERSVSVDEFFGADEAFITSSFKDIVPIVSADAQTIGNGAPGPITRTLIERFAQLTKTH